MTGESTLFNLLYRPGALLALLVLTACGRDHPGPVTAENYIGDATCVSCHAEQETFAHTAHRGTSAHATGATIHGSFREGENILPSVNPYLHYRMEARADGFYQTAVLEGAEEARTISERIDLVTGSGRKGQTYLYWSDDRLFQLPVSYWTELGDWIISPGYQDGVARFDRPINPRCLECHATYFDARQPADAPDPHGTDLFDPPQGVVPSNQYDTTRYVLGITCEKCHGGGREHVARQGSWFRRLTGQAIVNPARLSRERQVDGCALCHGGIGEPIQPPFTYPPGAPLEAYLHRPAPGPIEAVDVHGNQVALLKQSPCFQGSATMTCSTCHDVHQTQRDVTAFAPTCLSCHQAQQCGLFPEHGQRIADQCVSCHMPALPARSIVARRDGQPVQPAVRTHWIRVYPELRGE
jgi:hypothetical protein